MSVFPTKLLLAVDESEGAEVAARVAVELSGKTGSELHVVYVAPYPGMLYVPEDQEQMGGKLAELEGRRLVYAGPFPGILQVPKQEDRRRLAEREGRGTLDAQLEKIRGMGGQVSKSHLPIGRPDEEIVRLAEELGVGLLVVGSRGIGSLRRVLLGSVSGAVVCHAHCSVLVVRSSEENGPSLFGGKMIVAVDGSDDAALAVQCAAELAEAIGADLHLVHALPDSSRTPLPYPYTGEPSATSLEQAKNARDFVQEQAEKVEDETGIAVRAHLRLGRPDREIVALGEELDAGMLVVGSRGLGGIRRALMGSVSDSVVRHAHSTVLVARKAGSNQAT